MESINRKPVVSGVIHKDILGMSIPMVPTTVDDRYRDHFLKMGVILSVFIIDHPDMKLVHIEAKDMRSGSLHGWSGDNLNEGMDIINESIKQHRS